MTQDRVLKQMRRRRLDARLGRWSATERLVPLAQPPSGAEMAARWADQLLRRWGIVTRDLLAYEVAAPPWSELVREFKRRELLGQVSRGYFIESHQGEQYGLPEAVELLRECRGRRAEGEPGYLPGEPVLPLTNREPANLYASCLEVTDARGEIFPRHQRRGNLLHRLVVQAGQVLFYNSTQLVPLTRPQLLRALAALQHDAAGRDVDLSFGQWNGYPIAASPVASVLYELGFREESGGMRWPSRRKSPPPAVPNVDVFAPRWEEAPPAQYGPQWALAHASVTTRPLLARLLDALLPLTETEGWQGNWNVPNAQLGYRGTARLWLRIQKTYLEAIASCPVLRVAGERSGTWRRWRFTSEDQLTPDVAAEITAVLHAIQTRVDTYLAERET